MSVITWIKGHLYKLCPGQIYGPLLQVFTAKASFLSYTPVDSCGCCRAHVCLTEILKQDYLHPHFVISFFESDPPLSLWKKIFATKWRTGNTGRSSSFLPGNLHSNVLEEAFLHTHTPHYAVRIFPGQHLIHARPSHITSWKTYMEGVIHRIVVERAETNTSMTS